MLISIPDHYKHVIGRNLRDCV